MEQQNRKKQQELLRVLTLKDAVGVGLGAIIGAGIFVVTGVAGPSFLVGLLLAGAVAAFNGLSSAQLAAVYPQSGGTYEYGYRLLNPTLGFSAGWMFLISKLSAAGVVAIGFGSYFHQLVPVLPPLALSLAAVVLLTVAGSFEFIVRSASFAVLLYYSITNLAALRQPRQEQLYGKIIPVLGLVGCLAMSVSLPLLVILSGIGLLLVGFVLWRLFHKVYE